MVLHPDPIPPAWRPSAFVFSTDYPHDDTTYPEATAHFLKLPLGDEGKRKILWDNCTRLYGVGESGSR